jgi:hypothetical protein
LSEILPANFSDKPWEFSSVANYMDRDINGNLTRASNFESRPVWKPSGADRLKIRANELPAYRKWYGMRTVEWKGGPNNTPFIKEMKYDNSWNPIERINRDWRGYSNRYSPTSQRQPMD